MQRLILFDIDGTLLSAGGAGARALRAALMDVFGTEGKTEGVSFAGKTDPQIVRELLAKDPFEPAEQMPVLWDNYLARLGDELSRARLRVLPGVPELLARVEAASANTVLGLLTGNLREGARLKLEAAGIGFDRFAIGAYGCDHGDRAELPAFAVRRAEEQMGRRFHGKEIVIIGDTPHDIACGEALAVRTIAVATGSYSEEQLAACGPDFVFASLGDTDAVWAAITRSV